MKLKFTLTKIALILFLFVGTSAIAQTTHTITLRVDTVNIASRMESSSAAGKINVSHKTYELLKESFTFESRGTIEIKNRSAIQMYYLEGIK